MELTEALAELEKTKTALADANSESASRRKTAKELKDALAKFDGFNPDELKTLKEKAATAEQDRLKAEGKFDEALAEALKEKDNEIAGLKELISTKDTTISKHLIDNSVITAIDGKAINSAQVLSLIRGSIKMEGETPVVMDGDNPVLDKKTGEKVSVADFAMGFLEENPHLANPSGGGGGSQGNGNGDKGGADTVTRANFDTMSPEQQSAHSLGGGKIVD